MATEFNIFEKYILMKEAPDDPPETQQAPPSGGEAPPDIPAPEDTPPDITADDPPADLGGAEEGGDAPPDLGDMGGDEEPGSEGEENTEEQPEELEVDEKVSALMNKQLFKRYQMLLDNIASQISMVKRNSDILHTISEDTLVIIDHLKKLDEDVRLYIDNYFLKENYTKNLLFFNKCANVLKMIHDDFDKSIRKGKRDMDSNN